jgi:hypothetical protein
VGRAIEIDWRVGWGGGSGVGAHATGAGAGRGRRRLGVEAAGRGGGGARDPPALVGGVVAGVVALQKREEEQAGRRVSGRRWLAGTASLHNLHSRQRSPGPPPASPRASTHGAGVGDHHHHGRVVVEAHAAAVEPLAVAVVEVGAAALDLWGGSRRVPGGEGVRVGSGVRPGGGQAGGRMGGRAAGCAAGRVKAAGGGGGGWGRDPSVLWAPEPGRLGMGGAPLEIAPPCTCRSCSGSPTRGRRWRRCPTRCRPRGRGSRTGSCLRFSVGGGAAGPRGMGPCEEWGQ